MTGPEPRRSRTVVVAVLDVPADQVERLRRYEDTVLPLLSRHGGVLERRLGTADGSSELHVLSFADEAGYRAYRADPDRLAARSLLDGVDLTQRVLEGLVELS